MSLLTLCGILLFSFFGSTAGQGIDASASLAGNTNNGGSFGVGQASATAGGVGSEVIKTVSTNNVVSNGAPAVVGTTVNVASVSTIPTQSVDQLASEIDQIETQTQTQIQNTNIPTVTPAIESVPSEEIEQSDQSPDSEQSENPENSQSTTQSQIQSTTTLAPTTTVTSPSNGVPY